MVCYNSFKKGGESKRNPPFTKGENGREDSERTKKMSTLPGRLVFFLIVLQAVCVFSKDFVLNFNNVDIRTFIKFVGEYTGENYVIDPNVRGNITIYSNNPVSTKEINTIFKSVLNLYGFSAIKQGPITSIIPTAEARIRTTQINVGSVPPDKMEDFIIQLIPLKYYPPDILSQILTPYITRGGQITVDSRTNSLVISDTGRNVAKIQEIVSKIDVPSPPGKEMLKVYRLENTNAEELAKILTQLVAKPRQVVRRGEVPPMQPSIVAAKSTNSLIIYAEPDDFNNIEKIIKEMDVLTNQVLIEALIAEVSYEMSQKMGIEWAASDKFDNGDYTGAIGTNFGNLQNYVSTGVAPEGFSIGIIKGKVTFPLSVGALINLYSNDTHFNILSTPQIMTADNQEATINISENVPYLKETRFYQSSTTSGTGDIIKSYDYKDVGIILKITPQISQNKYVRLKLSQEVTKVIEGSTTEALTTAKRSVDTTLIVPNNKTIVLGGLVRDDTEHTVKKVPFLGNIPGLRRLFRTNSDKTTKTNLLIFITPHIITTFEEAEELKKEKEKIFEKKK